MVYFNNPTVTRTYTQVLTDLEAKIDAAAGLLSTDVTAYDNQGGGYPVRAIRWNASSNKFQRRNPANSGWEDLSSTWAFTAVTTTGNMTASGNVSGVDITASDQLQAARVNVTGTTEPANGLYRPATNEIRFTTNSLDRLTIESDGQVGIGTVDPARTLEVKGTARIQNGTSNAYLEIGKGGSGDNSAYIDFVGDETYTTYGLRTIRSGGANGSSSFIHRGTGSFILEAEEAADLIFKTTNLTRMVVDSGGKVCIGNDTSPDEFLHVKDGASAAILGIRVQNSEGYFRLLTNANYAYLYAERFYVKNRAGDTNLFNQSDTLHRIYTDAQVDGNLTVSGTLTASITGTADVATSVAVTDESSDTSCNILFATGATGNKAVKSGTNLTFNSSTGVITAPQFNGAVNGTASNASKLASLSLTASTNYWSAIPYIQSNGVMEIGKYIDFHTSDGSTSDHDGRIECTGSAFTFDEDVLPSGTQNLGSTSARWENLYVNDIQLSNKGQTNDVDGTWGDYTIQEGENDLYLLNRRNGKAYKFNLTEVGQNT
tara:strand:- start:223 stop:1854 length:1632 start_codon:yes stop_codon:yes gene_type:complete